jgi:hypothetical protein
VLDVVGLADTTTTLALNWDKMTLEQRKAAGWSMMKTAGMCDCTAILVLNLKTCMG